MKKLLFPLLVTCFWSGVQAQDNLPRARRRAVYGNGYYISASEQDYREVSCQITLGARTKYDKAKALFLWICQHISYDTKTNIRTADECWRQRRAVCQGYCELYYRMAETIGLDVDVIYGKCRNASGAEEEHGWLGIRTEKGYILADPTWGAGAVVNGEFRHQAEPLLWFDVDPEWFIFTHLPKQRKSQRLEHKITDEQYGRLSYATPLIQKLGFTPAEVMQGMMDGAGPLPILPTLSAAHLNKVELLQVPHTMMLKEGETHRLEIMKLDKDCKVALKYGGHVYEEKEWKKTENRLSITIATKQKGLLQILVTASSGYAQLQVPVLEYYVGEH